LPFLKIKHGAYKNTDEGVLPGEVGAVLIDGFEDELENTVKRPGLAEWYDTATGAIVNGLFYVYPEDKFLAISGSGIYKIAQDGASSTEISGAVNPHATNNITFAQDSKYVWMADKSQRLYYYDMGTSTVTLVTDTDSPALPSHVAYLNGYILANDTTSDVTVTTPPNVKFYYCINPTTAPNVWESASFATAEAEPDKIKALHVYEGELYLFGDRTLEIWHNDGVTPFSRLFSVGIGIGPAYSVVMHDNAVFWMDDKRRIIRMDGKTPRVISVPINKELLSYVYTDDCRAFVVSGGGQEFIVFTFPSKDITWAFNILTEKWSQWGFWNTTTETYNRYRIQSTAIVGTSIASGSSRLFYLPTLGAHLSDGKIYKIDDTAYSDYGNTIRTIRRSGSFNRGTFRKKRVNSLSANAVAKSSVTTSGAYPWTSIKGPWGAGWTDPYTNWADFPTGTVSDQDSAEKFQIRWRNDGKSDWGPWYDMPLNGKDGGFNITTLRRMGMYRTRQYEIKHDDQTSFFLSNLEEDVTVLSR